MSRYLAWLGGWLLVSAAHASVHVFVADTNGTASIKYECSAGETVRSFALDVTLDRGEIVGVTNYFRGPSSAQAQGYGVFPASFRDHLTVSSGTNVDWSPSAYSPVASVVDSPGDTLPGLGSSGVTLELGALWDAAKPDTAPGATGTLCILQMTQAATVSLALNVSRGGVVSALPDVPVLTELTGAMVGPAITSTTIVGGDINITFQDGELESATQVEGPWTGLGITNGIYAETLGITPARFFRVHNH